MKFEGFSDCEKRIDDYAVKTLSPYIRETAEGIRSFLLNRKPETVKFLEKLLAEEMTLQEYEEAWRCEIFKTFQSFYLIEIENIICDPNSFALDKIIRQKI